MLTKSKIQLIQENEERVASFGEAINNLMDKYMIEDNIFAFEGLQLMEVTKGYFEVKSEYNTLKEALQEIKADSSLCIRVKENNKFFTGHRRQYLSECKGGQILKII